MSLSTLHSRIRYDGGGALERINKQKLRSLKSAFKNDYNSHIIVTPKGEKWFCLFNENNLKSDYDKKYISVEYDAGLEPGDIVTFVNTHTYNHCKNPLYDTHWMIYLPRLTETAYLRSEIIRCRYTLNIDGNDYWLYFQGPTETDISWFKQLNIAYNKLNFSGTIYIKKDEHTLDFFSRFKTFKIENHIWQVQVTDSISVPGILEIEIQEYFDNPPAELPEIKKAEGGSSLNPIIGKLNVYPGDIVGYMIEDEHYNINNTWSITGDAEIVRTVEDNHMCEISINSNAIGDIILTYGAYSINITVEEKSLILGEKEVRPYDIITYQLSDSNNLDSCTYSISDINKAVIKSSEGSKCTVEIINSKKGNFNLMCEYTLEGSSQVYTTTLPITIKSL